MNAPNSTATRQPLDGIRVIDFTQVMMGPVATQVLADYGADVIKIERPGQGEIIRSAIDHDKNGGDHPVFRSFNRNKRSLAINISSNSGKKVVHELMRTADIVVNNFRSGVMDRLGFGYEALSKINPRIIFAEGTGFGITGPLSHKGGQDVLAQAYSGLMMRRSDETVPMTIYATTLADYTTGMHLVQAILLALRQRDLTGRGQRVAVSLFESMIAMQMQEAAMWMQRGFELNWGSAPLTGCFPTSDGAVVLVGAFRPNPLQDICRALDIEDISADPRFVDFTSRMKHKAYLQGIFKERFRTNTTEYWISRLEEQDLLCAPVQTLAQALDSEQTAANGTIVAVDHINADGTVEHARFVGTPLTMSDQGFKVRRPAPRLGEHNCEILSEIGLSDQQFAEQDNGKNAA